MLKNIFKSMKHFFLWEVNKTKSYLILGVHTAEGVQCC